MYESGRAIGFWSAVLLGVGAMAGAGIFALLGQAGAVAGSAVWLSFLLGGGVAALSGYSFGRLGARYPSAGGLVEYLIRAWGGGFFAGTGAFVLYLSGLLALALIAKAFGSYASALLIGDAVPWVANLLAVTVIAVLTMVNLQGPADVATVENVVVLVKVGVLALFFALGATGFVIVGVAALVSTASAINANLYAQREPIRCDQRGVPHGYLWGVASSLRPTSQTESGRSGH